ncbi:MAG: glycosyltransferase family 39 protein [Planctomycetes bacterium]|nr:glycosyltransferase family 39 protein [Planctomycetota bacterium]
MAHRAPLSAAPRRGILSHVSKKLESALLALIVALAFGVRWTVVAQYERSHPLADRPVIDEQSYDRWAREIASGEWLGRDIFFQEPGYPYALGALYAAVGGDPTHQRECARRAQVVLGALTTLLVAGLARRLFGPGAGLCAAALFALHRAAVWFPVLLLKENVFLPLFVGFAWTLASASDSKRPATWWSVGALAAFGALLRGNMLVLIPCFVAWPVVVEFCTERAWRRGVVGALLVGVGAACVLLPVARRNQVVGGRFVLTTSGAGTNFYGGNNLDNPYGVAKEFDWVRGIPKYEAADWRHEAERRSGRALDAAETSSFWASETLRSMAAQPAFHLRALWRKFRLALGTYEVPDNHFLEWDAAWVPLLRAPLLGFGLVGTLGVGGMLAAAWLRRRASPWSSLALFALYLGTIVLTVMSERARLVLVPLLAVFAGGWLVHVFTRDAVRRGLVFACVLVAAPLVLVPTFDSGARQRDLDERDYNLATILISDGGDLVRARSLGEALAVRYPGTPRAALLLADIEWRLARRVLDEPKSAAADAARARTELDRIVASLDAVEARADPQERFRLTKLRGAIRQFQGDFAAAERDYRVARDFDPEDPDVARRLAVSLANRAMGDADATRRRAGLVEAAGLLEALATRTPDDEELVRLAREVRAAAQR